MPFQGASPKFQTDLVSLPRQDTHTLHLDSFLNPDAYLHGFGITEQQGRELLQQIMGEQLNYQSLLDYTELTGRTNSINSLEYFNYESGLMERSVKVTAVLAGSTAATQLITLDADSYSTTGSINGPQDRSPLKVGDLILTAPALYTGIVVAKSGSGSATQYSIQRRDLVSDDLLGALQAHASSGTRLITYSMASPEGSKSPDEGIYNSTIRLTNQMQTFRSRDGITGDVDALRRAVPWQGKTLQIDVTALKQQWHHRMGVNRAMYLAPGGNITLAGSGPGSGRVRLTTGLIPGIAQLGATFLHDATAGYAAADIDAMDQLAIANYTSTSFTVFEGPAHGTAFYKGIKDMLGTAIVGIDFSAFGTKGDPKQKAIDLGFQSVTTPSGITYHRQRSSFFNEPEVTAVAGYPFKDMAIFIPGGDQNITVDQNGQNTKISVPSLEILHTTASSGESRRFRTFYRGIEIDGIDQKVVDTFTQQGLRVVNLRKFILGKAA